MNNNTMNSKGSRKFFASMLAVAALTMAASGVSLAQAQTQTSDSGDRLTAHFSDPNQPGTVRVSLVNGGVAVKAYDGKDVIVEEHSRDGDPVRPPEARPSPGMHRIFGGGAGLSADVENNVIDINTDSVFRTVDLAITVPVHTSLSVKTVGNGSISVNGVDGDIDITEVNGTITLTNVSGSAVAHTINGRLEATFNRLTPGKPVALSSMNGDIDVTFPPDAKATLNLHADRGGVYSDFDVQFVHSGGPSTTEDSEDGRHHHMRMMGGAHATINGGGADVQLSNFNGNIYIHKSGAAR